VLAFPPGRFIPTRWAHRGGVARELRFIRSQALAAEPWLWRHAGASADQLMRTFAPGVEACGAVRGARKPHVEGTSSGRQQRLQHRASHHHAERLSGGALPPPHLACAGGVCFASFCPPLVALQGSCASRDETDQSCCGGMTVVASWASGWRCLWGRCACRYSLSIARFDSGDHEHWHVGVIGVVI
jgi:hypothetical protein